MVFSEDRTNLLPEPVEGSFLNTHPCRLCLQKQVHFIVVDGTKLMKLQYRIEPSEKFFYNNQRSTLSLVGIEPE